MLTVSRVMALLGAGLLLLIPACDRSQDRIVGNWKVQNDASATVWEFSKNGTVKAGNISGRYTFIDRGRLKIQTPFATFVYVVELSGDTLIWQDPNGSKTKLKRIP